MKVLGVEFAPIFIPLHRRIETLCLCVAIFLVLVLPFLSIPLFIYLCFTKYWWVTAVYVIWIIIDKETPEKGGRPIEWVRKCIVFQYARNYFPVRAKLVPGCELDPKTNYLCACFPHGFMPLGVFTAMTSGVSKQFENHIMLTMTINGNFYIPLFRDFLLSIGLCKASPKAINYLLNHPEGGRMLLLPVGGSLEALYFKSGEYRIILKNRKGFIKLALKNGCPVIPIFSFGENSVWKQIIFEDSSPIRKFQLWVRQKINVALVILFGRGIFQYSFGVLPYRKPINFVVGKPLIFKKIEEPSQADIDAAHQTYVEALVGIFEKYKYEYEENPESCKLIIQ